MTVLTAAQVYENVDLRQYGVKGMHWGVTTVRSLGRSGKKKPADSTSTESKSDPPAIDTEHMKAVASRSKSVQELSNKELQDAINRINLEKQYQQVLESTAPPTAPSSKKRKAADFVAGVMLDAGKKEASKLIQAEINKRTGDFLESKGRADLARAIRSKEENKRRDDIRKEEQQQIQNAITLATQKKPKAQTVTVNKTDKGPTVTVKVKKKAKGTKS